ncbi:MFS transporter [Variovorax robiniae]|uniref:MFS transporter n=1 Tax=Variovorax robiniae TaxID=1836199 RepID=A0ABU8XF67_9BURK
MTPAAASLPLDAIEAQTKVRWKIFLAILFLMAVNYIDRASLSVAMPIIAKEFDLSPAMQGLLLSSFFWTYALMQIPGGMLADRFKPRVVIASSTILWGFFQAIAAGSSSFVTLLITRLGLGASEAPLYPAGAKLNAMWMTQNERGRGATLLDGGAPLGAALGSIIIAWLIASLGSWRLSFVVAGVGTIVAGIWCWYFIRNTPREHPGVNEAEADYIEAAHKAEDAKSTPSKGGSVMNFFRYRSIWGMCLGWMGFSVMFTGFIAWLPSYLLASYGFNIKTMGGASFLIYMSGFVGEMVAGWISDKWKARGGTPNTVLRTMFGIAAVIATASIFTVAYVSDAVLAVVLLCCALFFLRWFGLFWSLPAILGGRERAGFVGGTMNLSGQIAGIGVPIIIGVIVQASGGSYFGALMFMAGAGVAMFIAAMMIDYSKKLPV